MSVDESIDPVSYYEANAQGYFDQVIGVDTRGHLKPLLHRLPSGGLVIDAGCGTGRDTKFMRDAKFDVYPFDAAPSLAKLAEAHTGAAVHVHRFNDLKTVAQADGVLAMASLLFLNDDELKWTLGILGNALVPGGYMLVSFKEGRGSHTEGSRIYYNKQVGDMRWMAQAAGAIAVNAWSMADKLGRAQSWVYFLMQKPTGRQLAQRSN